MQSPARSTSSTLTPAELSARLTKIALMPMDAYRIKLQSDLTLEAMHSGWLTYAASELLIEFESLKSGFNLHDFILRMSGIDLNEDFSFLYDRTHKVLRWYQRPLVN